MKNVEIKSFEESENKSSMPDGLGEASVVEFGENKVTSMHVKPGWRWSEHIKPLVGTDSCQVRHLGVIIHGTVTVEHDDGTRASYGAGDAYSIMPGHDAWVEGNEEVRGFDFGGSWVEQI